MNTPTAPALHTRRQSPQRFRTAILVMPFGPISFPDVGSSVLKAAFHQAGYPLDVKYCTFDFAARIGMKQYNILTNNCNQYLVSEYPFATDLRADVPPFREFIKAVLPPGFGQLLGAVGGQNYDVLPALMDGIVPKVKGYLDDLEETLDLSSFNVIGFATSYAQNSAAWAFAKRLRRRYPEATLVFGGANCQGVMGQAQVDAYDFIDYACTGEGEISFLQLVRWLEDPVDNHFPAFGIVSRQRRMNGSPQELVDMSASPTPDYADYFQELDKRSDWRRWYYALPMESSRGCWWGAKHQCVFCGLNGPRLVFRQKPAGKFMEELREVRRKYGERAKYIQLTDNIMPRDFFDTFLPLAGNDRPYDTLFYEIRSNLTHEQIRQLRDAGVTFLQPGVESLSTPVLKLMGKGVDGIANVQTLKFATEYGIRLLWSVLCDVPGEKPEHYEEMAALIPQLYHLDPPKGLTEINIVRYSPLFEDPKRYGLSLQPASAYRHLYGLPDEIIADLAVWFEDNNRPPPVARRHQIPGYVRPCHRQIQIWQKSFLKFKNVRLDYEVVGDDLHLTDTRSGVQNDVTLSGNKKLIALAAREIVSFADIRSAVKGARPSAEETEIRDALEELIDASYILREGDRYLFLGLDRSNMTPRAPSGFWLEKYINQEEYVFS